MILFSNRDAWRVNINYSVYTESAPIYPLFMTIHYLILATAQIRL